MRYRYILPYVIGVVLLAWVAFVATQSLRHFLRMRSIAQELGMGDRSFYLLAHPLEPLTAVDGEERLLVVGKLADDYLLCSIVRNPKCNDERRQWRVDACFRPDRQPEDPRLPIWEPLDRFPTALDVERFRSEALPQPWVKWDCPEGSNPSLSQGQWAPLL